MPSSTKKADNAGVASAVEKEQKGIVSLLYDPFDLITSERRRMQANLLQEYMLELKVKKRRTIHHFQT